MNAITLQTDRLVLRPISLDDAPAVQRHFNNWEIIKHLAASVPWPYPDDGAEQFIRDSLLPRLKSDWQWVWVLVLKGGSGEAIGVVDFGVSRSALGDRGFWLSPAFQGQGLMTEACAAVNDFLFFDVGIEKFTVVNAISNIGSRRVKEKTGAQFVGFGELAHHNGDTKTEVWQVTQENWRQWRRNQ